jgi:hypothetical protein
MFSLAPLRYRTAFAESGGPIQRTEFAGTLEIEGRPETQVNAFLRPELAAGKMAQSVYGSADGTGSSETPIVAEHKAISEAIERWAFLSVHSSGEGEKYGFTHDCSSNGMAAFPGFAFQAKSVAYAEALERWALVGWWAGFLGGSRCTFGGGIEGIRIHHGQAGEVLVLCRSSKSGSYSYGHASGKNLRDAAAKAEVELARTEFVLSRHRAKGVLGKVSNFLERRAVYFSSEDGHAEFNERADRPADKPQPIWRTIFNGEIPGPWSQWATVWRHCVEMPTYAFLNKEENFFFW